MRPPTTVTRRVRIAFTIGKCMVDTMRGYPGNGSSLQRHGTANAQEILDRLWSLISTMGEKTMISHPDSQTPSDPPEQNSNRKRLPGEHKKRPDRAGVKEHHEDRHSPISFRSSLINCSFIRHALFLFKPFLIPTFIL
jgi:hypothetical protein